MQSGLSIAAFSALMITNTTNFTAIICAVPIGDLDDRNMFNVWKIVCLI
jgi:hypothetical protein